MSVLLIPAFLLGSVPAKADLPELPSLQGTWALYQVIAEYWEVPLLGERLRRVLQVARLRIEQDGDKLTLWSEEVCSMVFDMGTALVQISVLPEFVRSVQVGPIPARIEREEGGSSWLFHPTPF